MSKVVYTKDEADLVAISFQPKKFANVVSKVASDFVAYQNHKTDTSGTPSFRLDRIVAEQTGVAELERLSIEEKVEREALERLKSVQEEAYQQAYNVGLEEGRESSFNDFRSQFEERIQHFDSLLGEMTRLKSELVSYNEAHIVGLVYHLAKRIAMNEIEQHPEFVLNVVNQAVQSAQVDENVTVRLAPQDVQFIESIRPKLGKEFDALKNVKLEAADDIRPGGCIVRTNYGAIDSTIEQRVEKLWTALIDKIPRSHDEAGQG